MNNATEGYINESPHQLPALLQQTRRNRLGQPPLETHRSGTGRIHKIRSPRKIYDITSLCSALFYSHAAGSIWQALTRSLQLPGNLVITISLSPNC